MQKFKDESNSCFDAAMVVRGSYGGYINQKQKIWDNMSECLLLEEAGARVTDTMGKELEFKNPLRRSQENFTLFAASPSLHKQLQIIINQTLT